MAQAVVNQWAIDAGARLTLASFFAVIAYRKGEWSRLPKSVRSPHPERFFRDGGALRGSRAGIFQGHGSARGASR